MSIHHPTDDELVLWYYRDQSGSASVGEHVTKCGECTTRLGELARVLDAVSTVEVAEPARDFEERMWGQVSARLDQPGERPRSGSILVFPRGARIGSSITGRHLAAAAILVAIVGSFVAGRWSHPPAEEMAAENIESLSERVLRSTVGDHLDASEVVLLELANARASAPLDISMARAWADDLVPSNRLYRQTAGRTGDGRIVEVLDELERVLLEVARGPSELSVEQIENLREQIDEGGLLFRLRAVQAQLQHEPGSRVTPAAREVPWP